MAWHLLQHDRDGARRIAEALQSAVVRVRHCQRCHTFTEAEVYSICRDPSRDVRQLAVVETPADQAALDRAGDGQVEEVIIATNFTAEGEATAHVLAEALGSRGIRVTRLARGVPI